MKVKTRTAVILAAGEGKRLDILDNPKPLVKVGNKSLILWNIEQLQEADIKEIFIVLGFRGDEIKKELTNNLLIKANLRFIWQKDSSKKGMLKSLTILKGLIKEPFFLVMSDLIIEKNPYKFFARTKKNKNNDVIQALACIHSKQYKKSGALSKIIVQGDTIKEIGKDLKVYNGFEIGIYHFGTKSFDLTLVAQKTGVKDFEGFLKYLSKQGKLKAAFLKNSEWFDVNDSSALIRGELFLKASSFKRKKSFTKKRKAIRIKRFINFYNKKNIRTEVIVKSGMIKNLENYEIIPENLISSPHYLITDKNVDKIYGKKIAKVLKKQGFNLQKIVVESGEQAKDVNNYIRLAEKILGMGIEEKSIIISLGGGVVNNLTGFLAATLYRGVGLIHIPTTLMAQSDAAIGIKQGVNGDKGKNLIGSYYEPLRIFVDPELLLSMDEYYIRDGLGECLKHALAQDKNYYKFFRNYQGSVKNLKFLEKVICVNIKLKIKLMQKDFKEENEAIVLQYGHEIGHAVEFLSGFKFGHGEAVAIGMRVSAEIAKGLRLAEESIVQDHLVLLKQYNLPYKIPKYIKPEDIFDALRYNKKMKDGDIRFALTERIGSLWHYKNNYAISCSKEIIMEAIKNSYE